VVKGGQHGARRARHHDPSSPAPLSAIRPVIRVCQRVGVFVDAVVLVNQGKDSNGNDHTPTRWQTRITGRIAERGAGEEGS